MRYYLMGPDNKEFVVDLKRTTRTSANAVEYDYQAVSSKGEILHQDKVFLKKLARRKLLLKCIAFSRSNKKIGL